MKFTAQEQQLIDLMNAIRQTTDATCKKILERTADRLCARMSSTSIVRCKGVLA